MNQRTIAWGTTIAGAIALGTAVLVGLTEIADVSIPFATGGPGAVIAVGVLILFAGLAVVIRSNRSSRRAVAAEQSAAPTTPPAVTQQAVTPPAVTTPAPSAAPRPPVGSPLDMPPATVPVPQPQAEAETEAEAEPEPAGESDHASAEHRSGTSPAAGPQSSQ